MKKDIILYKEGFIIIEIKLKIKCEIIFRK
jgi:hypothetical protein